MKNVFKGIGFFLAVVIIGVGLSFAFGWSGVFYTKTVGKASQNAKREVFEETQSYVEGKRQEALKFYKEYSRAETTEDKQAIEEMVSISFANFEESKLPDKLSSFVYQCKY